MAVSSRGNKDIINKTAEQLSNFLREEIPGIEEEVIENVKKHKLDGDAFLQLDEEYLREIAPLLGDRIKLKRFISSALEPPSVITSPFTTPEAVNSHSTPSCSIIDGPPISCKTPSTPAAIESLQFMESVQSLEEHSSDDTVDMKDIPNSRWLDTLEVPTRFSKATMAAITSGSVLLPSARNEIVDSFATIIMLKTRHPTSEQLEKLAKKLITTYPSLADKVPGGVPYGSWKKKLQNKFKNLNRPQRARVLDLTIEEKPSKIRKTDLANEKPNESQMNEYNRHVVALKQSYNSKKWLVSSLSSLLNRTFDIRRHWIKTDRPPVATVLAEYPCLKEVQLMIHEFHLIIGFNHSRLLENFRQLLSYALSEKKKEVRGLITEYKLLTDPTEDQTVVYSLAIASSLSCQRGKGKAVVFVPFQGQYLDTDSAIASVKYNHPIIVGFGENLSTLNDATVIIEQTNIIRMPSFIAAIEYCLACYYVFDIQYPSNCKPLCVLLEYLYGMDVSVKKLPLSIQPVIDALFK